MQPTEKSTRATTILVWAHSRTGSFFAEVLHLNEIID